MEEEHPGAMQPLPWALMTQPTSTDKKAVRPETPGEVPTTADFLWSLFHPKISHEFFILLP